MEKQQYTTRTGAKQWKPVVTEDELHGIADLIDIETGHAETTAALAGCLAQITGPAIVHGDGRGNDGRKTGLSGAEFNALRAERIAAARKILAKHAP